MISMILWHLTPQLFSMWTRPKQMYQHFPELSTKAAAYVNVFLKFQHVTISWLKSVKHLNLISLTLLVKNLMRRQPKSPQKICPTNMDRHDKAEGVHMMSCWKSCRVVSIPNLAGIFQHFMTHAETCYVSMGLCVKGVVMCVVVPSAVHRQIQTVKERQHGGTQLNQSKDTFLPLIF